MMPKPMSYLEGSDLDFRGTSSQNKQIHKESKFLEHKPQNFFDLYSAKELKI